MINKTGEISPQIAGWSSCSFWAQVGRRPRGEALLDSWCDEIYSGGSGKSTIVKQMKLVHGECSSQAHRRAFTEICRSNVLTAMAAILEACQVQGSNLPPHLHQSQLRVIKAAESGSGGNLYSPHLASDISNLWADLTVRAMAERGSQFQVMPVSSLLTQTAPLLSWLTLGLTSCPTPPGWLRLTTFLLTRTYSGPDQ